MATKEYNEGFLAGQDHRTASPETKHLIENLHSKLDNNIKPLVTKEHCNNNLKGMADKLDKISDKLEDMMIKIAEMPQEILDIADNRYATKKTEKTVDKVTWLVISSVVIGLPSEK